MDNTKYLKASILCFIACGIISAMILFQGCLFSDSPSVCELEEAQTSVICKIAGKIGRTPEDVGNVLKLTNVAVLTADKLDAKKAYAFLEEVGEDLDAAIAAKRTLTYNRLLAYINKKFDILPPRIKKGFTAIMVLDTSSPLAQEALTAFDMQLIQKHIRDEMNIVSMYIE